MPGRCDPSCPSAVPGAGKEDQLGLLYDAKGASGTYGHNCTVYLVNLFELPPTEAEFLLLPRCVYDTFAELADGRLGRRLDLTPPWTPNERIP